MSDCLWPYGLYPPGQWWEKKAFSGLSWAFTLSCTCLCSRSPGFSRPLWTSNASAFPFKCFCQALVSLNWYRKKVMLSNCCLLIYLFIYLDQCLSDDAVSEVSSVSGQTKTKWIFSREFSNKSKSDTHHVFWGLQPILPILVAARLLVFIVTTAVRLLFIMAIFFLFFLLYLYEKRDVSWMSSGNHFMTYVNQTITLYVLKVMYVS